MGFMEGDAGPVRPEVVGGIWTGCGALTGPAGQEHGGAAEDGRAPRVGQLKTFSGSPANAAGTIQLGGK